MPSLRWVDEVPVDILGPVVADLVQHFGAILILVGQPADLTAIVRRRRAAACCLALYCTNISRREGQRARLIEEAAVNDDSIRILGPQLRNLGS